MKTRKIIAFFTILIFILFIAYSIHPLYRVDNLALSSEDTVYSLSEDPSIKVIGTIWNKASLSVLIVKPSWLEEKFLDSAIKAFDAWDRALESFGNSYGFMYLSKFSFKISVSNYRKTGYDIVVEFNREAVKPGGEIGKAIIKYYDSKISHVDIILYIQTSKGKLLPRDLFNVALHEIGHALGLDHSSSRETLNGPELMYPIYSYPGIELRPSTLDAYAIAKLYSWLKTGKFQAVKISSISLPINIPYKILLYYRVKVYSEYGNITGEGWYLEGTTAKISLQSTIVYLDSGIRAVFSGWCGYVTSKNSSIEIVVNEDIEIRALWKIQYYINITTSFSGTNIASGWYDSGKTLYINLSSTIVYLDEWTRYVFDHWSGNIESKNSSLKVVVDKPLNLIAEWRLEYKVDLETPYSSLVTSPGWYSNGSIIKISVREEIIDFKNDTRLKIVGWNGTISLKKPNVKMIVKEPLKLKAIWHKEYLVKLYSSYGESFEKWFTSGYKLDLSLNITLISYDNNTRRIFGYWIVDNKTISSQLLHLIINKPYTIKAVWSTEYLVYIKTVDMDNEPVQAVMYLNRTQVSVGKEGVHIWLRRGVYEISNASYMNFEEVSMLQKLLSKKTGFVWLSCKPEQGKISVIKPGDYVIKLLVYNAEFKIVDWLGVPSPLYVVDVGRRYISDPDGYLLKSKLSAGCLKVRIYFLILKIGEQEIIINHSGTYNVQVPVSSYTACALFLALIAYRKLSKKA